MTLTDDLLAEHGPFLSPDLTAYLTAIGSMWAEVEQYAADPDDTDEPTLLVPYVNRVPNPNFNYDAVGEPPAKWWVTMTCPTFEVDSNWPGRPSTLHVVTPTLTNAQQVTLGPNGGQTLGANSDFFLVTDPVVSGRADYLINSITGTMALYLECLFYDSTGAFISAAAGGQFVTAAGEGNLQSRFSVPSNAAGYLLRLTAYANADGSSMDFNVDKVLDGLTPSVYGDGDTDGWEWSGTPGASSSQVVLPVPQVGWSIMLDVNRIPTTGLPYLAQWVGERLPAGLTDAQARQWITYSPHQVRGTPYSIARAAQRWLTGKQTVFMRERSDLDLNENPDALAILTYADETPDPNLVLGELRKTVPSGIVLYYDTAETATWGGIETLYSNWSAVAAANATWADVEAQAPGSVPAGFETWTMP